MQLHWVLCVLKNPHKIGGGQSCFMPVGLKKAKIFWSESPNGLQMQHNVCISLEDQWPLIQIAEFVLYSPELLY